MHCHAMSAKEQLAAVTAQGDNITTAVAANKKRVHNALHLKAIPLNCNELFLERLQVNKHSQVKHSHLHRYTAALYCAVVRSRLV